MRGRTGRRFSKQEVTLTATPGGRSSALRVCRGGKWQDQSGGAPGAFLGPLALEVPTSPEHRLGAQSSDVPGEKEEGAGDPARQGARPALRGHDLRLGPKGLHTVQGPRTVPRRGRPLPGASGRDCARGTLEASCGLISERCPPRWFSAGHGCRRCAGRSSVGGAGSVPRGWAQAGGSLRTRSRLPHAEQLSLQLGCEWNTRLPSTFNRAICTPAENAVRGALPATQQLSPRRVRTPAPRVGRGRGPL